MQMIKRKPAGALFVAAALALAACSAEDGAPGASGQDGTDGVSCTLLNNGDGTVIITCSDGTEATIASGSDGADGADGAHGQSCTLTNNSDGSRTLTCPDGTSIVLPVDPVAGKVWVSGQTVAHVGNDVVITFNVKVNGVNSNAFTTKLGSYYHAAATPGPYARNNIATTAFSVAAGTNGNYTVTIPGLVTTVGDAPTTYLIRLNTGPTAPQAAVVAHSPAGKPKSTVSDQACINCHGANVFWKDLHRGSYNPQGVGACVVCHVRNTQTRGEQGDRLKSYVHGIHNSYNMPNKEWARTATSKYKVTFPSHMNNCSTCHDTQENLDLVLNKPVTFSTCMSCHDNWSGFKFAGPAAWMKPYHETLTATTNCNACHGGGVTPGKEKVGDFHKNVLTSRGGLLWDGKDQSVELAKKVKMEITDVERDGTNIKVSWIAYDPTNGDARYNPCNGNYDAGPVFFGKSGITANPCTNTPAGCNSNLAIRRAFAQGNDWVNAGVGTAPGQPAAAVSLSPTSQVPTPPPTICSAENVATTTISLGATGGSTKGIAVLNGRQQAKGPNGNVIWVRSATATREFMVADGAEPAAADKRRRIVAMEKCMSCHQGSLYQHGGDRIDDPMSCVICHNPAGNEKNVRMGMGIDASNSHDGKSGETFDFRYMLHAIHSSGRTGGNLVYYRSNAVYGWGEKANLRNWPTDATEKIVCNNGTVYYKVPGSSASGIVPQVVDEPGAACNTATSGSNPAPASTDGTWRPYNYHKVTYPQPLYSCDACHVNDSHKELPNATRSVAVTVDPGAVPWSNQLDDVLMGPIAATCMSCHQSGDKFTQSLLRAHAFQNGWTPTTFPNGRQDLLDGVAVESCAVCHGPGRTADFTVRHGY
jgi:OmcA/MtrC family decaheme c-type cytochrome